MVNKYLYLPQNKRHPLLHIVAKILHCALHASLVFIASLAALSNLVFEQRTLMIFFTIFMLLELLVLIFCFKLKNRLQKTLSICMPLAGFIALTVCVGLEELGGVETASTKEEYLTPYEPYGPAETSKLALLSYEPYLTLEYNLPHLDGYSSFYPVYAAFVQAVYPAQEYTLPKANAPDDEAEFAQFNNIVLCSGKDAAYQNLIAGTADIIFCTAPSDEVLAQAASMGRDLHLTQIAKEAFVFFVNRKNPVKSITQQNIQNIYSGILTEWQTLGGKNATIETVLPNKDSYEYAMLLSIMDGRPLMPSHEEYAKRHRRSKNEIGCAFRFSMPNITEGSIRPLQIDGAEPSEDAVGNGLYPYTQIIYAVTAGNEGENTRLFIDWIVSPEGQGLVAKSGYVPIGPYIE